MVRRHRWVAGGVAAACAAVLAAVLVAGLRPSRPAPPVAVTPFAAAPTPTAAAQPGAREHAAMAFDPAGARVLLFGGFAGQEDVLGDTWAWDGRRWAALDPPVRPPPSSYANA